MPSRTARSPLRFLANRLSSTLGALLGVMQVVVGHWIVVVVAGREGPGLLLGLALAALLVAANTAAIPALRRARRGTRRARWVAHAYMTAGLATLLLGTGIVVAWIGFLPVAGALRLLGANPELALGAFRVLSTAVVVSLAGMILWGFTVGRVRVELTERRVALPGLSPSLAGLRIAQVSDLHIGNALVGDRLSRFVEQVNALDADLIALTGDIFDLDPGHVAEGARRLAALRARHGVYAVLGNHDVYTGLEVVAQGLARHAPRVRLLRGRIVRVPVSEPLYLAGVDDPGRISSDPGVRIPALDALARDMPRDGPTLLLVHRPEAFPQAASLGFPLVLAGHTHGGQIALPTRGGRLNLARLVTRFDRGLHRANGALLYVNRGAGFAGPALRVGSPREIATIELAAACP